jgi:hypothetical protein
MGINTEIVEVWRLRKIVEREYRVDPLEVWLSTTLCSAIACSVI